MSAFFGGRGVLAPALGLAAPPAHDLSRPKASRLTSTKPASANIAYHPALHARHPLPLETPPHSHISRQSCSSPTPPATTTPAARAARPASCPVAWHSCSPPPSACVREGSCLDPPARPAPQSAAAIPSPIPAPLTPANTPHLPPTAPRKFPLPFLSHAPFTHCRPPSPTLPVSSEFGCYPSHQPGRPLPPCLCSRPPSHL